MRRERWRRTADSGKGGARHAWEKRRRRRDEEPRTRLFHPFVVDLALLRGVQTIA